MVSVGGGPPLDAAEDDGCVGTAVGPVVLPPAIDGTAVTVDGWMGTAVGPVVLPPATEGTAVAVGSPPQAAKVSTITNPDNIHSSGALNDFDDNKLICKSSLEYKELHCGKVNGRS